MAHVEASIVGVQHIRSDSFHLLVRVDSAIQSEAVVMVVLHYKVRFALLHE